MHPFLSLERRPVGEDGTGGLLQARPIPTLSEWGVIAMSELLRIAGAVLHMRDNIMV